MPNSIGNENDALLALVDGKWAVLRVPYPLSFYAKGLAGRIDDPNGGWSGPGVRTTSGDRVPRLKEGGKGTVPIAFHFQFRPTRSPIDVPGPDLRRDAPAPPQEAFAGHS